MIPTITITQRKFDHKFRLAVDEAWLTREVTINTPPFRFGGINDFECWIKCEVKRVPNVNHAYYKVQLSLESRILDTSMKERETFRNHLLFSFTVENADGTETGKCDYVNNNMYVSYLRETKRIVNGKVAFIVTATYAPPHCINNDVSTCNVQLLPHEIMQFDEQSCDLKIVVGDLYIHAHKAFVSLISPVFAAMFTHNTKEAQTGAVNITDFDYGTVKTAINMLYGHPFEPHSIQEVIAVTRFAEKYMIKTAVERLETWLTGNITIDNFDAIVEYAWNHSSDKLKHLCANFYHQHAHPGFPLIDPVISAEMMQLLG
uniref:BTB domain-containing protein n=1 Tax=Panagrellus redivivus TaxID=6233 RepID=A0A7E4W7B0_PANRE